MVTAIEKCVRALPKINAFLPETIGEPVMLVQAHARRKRKIRTNPNQHPAPLLIVHVKVVLNDPALGDL
jgi:hypothetical protein